RCRRAAYSGSARWRARTPGRARRQRPHRQPTPASERRARTHAARSRRDFTPRASTPSRAAADFMLFHVSEDGGIQHFSPLVSDRGEAVVWAVDEAHLRNYLLPRDCPRVTFYAGPATNPSDIDSFLGSSPAVVAVEAGWFDRLRTSRLYCYHPPPAT